MSPIAIILVLVAWIVLLIDRIPQPTRNLLAIGFIAAAAIVVAVHGRVLA